MKMKFILPALTEAESPLWRPIKYSLFPPLGLATLAAYLDSSDEAEIVDQHVEELSLDDYPDIVAIEVYITNAKRAYKIADHYRRKSIFVILGGLHVTSLPDEASKHADAIFLGPAEESFPRFLKDYRRRAPQERCFSSQRSLIGIPPIRRDLIKRGLYLVPNSIVVTRGCPHHCDATKTLSSKTGESHFTHRAWMMLSVRLDAYQVDTSIFLMTISLATSTLPLTFSVKCRAWDVFSKVPQPLTPF